MDKKILIVIDSLKRGGAERQFVELTKGLQEITEFKNFEILVFDDKTEFPEINNLKFRINYIKRNIKKDFTIFQGIYKILKRFKPDIVHCWDKMTVYYFAVLKIFFNYKLINGSVRSSKKRSDFSAFYRIIIPFNFLMSDKIISNSISGIISMKVPDAKAKVIYNGFDMNRVQNRDHDEDIKSRYNLQTCYVVGMIANFSNFKDYESFFDVANKLTDQRKDISFVAVGSGKYFDFYKSKIIPEKSDRIILTGKLSNVEEIIPCIDIGLLLSSKYGEGISNSIIEYMAFSKPVIATDCEGNKELVVDNETGFLVLDNDVDTIIHHIITLLSDKNRRNEMGEKGKNRIESLFNNKVMIKNYIELYNSIKIN